MDPVVNQLARDLGEAISAAVAEDARVEACLEGRGGRYDLKSRSRVHWIAAARRTALRRRQALPPARPPSDDDQRSAVSSRCDFADDRPTKKWSSREREAVSGRVDSLCDLCAARFAAPGRQVYILTATARRQFIHERNARGMLRSAIASSEIPPVFDSREDVAWATSTLSALCDRRRDRAVPVRQKRRECP